MTVLIDYTGGAFAANKAQKVGTITEGTGTYNLSVASYDGVSFSVAAQEADPVGLFFKPDGTKCYVIGLSSDAVIEYSLGTAWDVSSASFVNSLSVTAKEAAPRDLWFKSDGTEVYVVGTGSNSVHQYSLSTAWDVSSGTFTQSFSVSAQSTFTRGVTFKPDGTKMYVTSTSSDLIYQYSLSTAWDISTSSYDSKSLSTGTINPTAPRFNPDGTKLWLIDNSPDDVRQYSLATAWDVSTGSYDNVLFDVSGQETTAQGLFFKSDGSKMYVVGSVTDTIYQYSTGTATSLDASTGNYFAYTPTADTTFTFSNAPASGTATGFALAVTGASVGSSYDIANATYDTVSFSVAAQEAGPAGLFFKPDGTKMYVSGQSQDNVNEYNLSTPWDVSTASFLQLFSVAAQDILPAGLFFKPDGTKMYVVGSTGYDVNEYDLSTAWDVSTASFLQLFFVQSQEISPRDIFFKPDGTKMYIVGSTGDEVNEYNLSTPWDVSTASFLQLFSVAAQDTTPVSVFFKPDGTKMFVLGDIGDDVNEYNLSTAWDVSTASFRRTFGVSAQETTPRSLFFKADGTKMYVTGTANDTVYQYTTGTAAPATFTYPTAVDWPAGTAPDAPAVGETDVLAFYTDDGGTNWYGFQAGDAMA